MKIYLIILETNYGNVFKPDFSIPSYATTEEEALKLLDAHRTLSKRKNQNYSIIEYKSTLID